MRPEARAANWNYNGQPCCLWEFNDALANRVVYEVCYVMDARFQHDFLSVVRHCLEADAQAPAYFFGTLAFRDEPKHLNLALREIVVAR